MNQMICIMYKYGLTVGKYYFIQGDYGSNYMVQNDYGKYEFYEKYLFHLC